MPRGAIFKQRQMLTQKSNQPSAVNCRLIWVKVPPNRNQVTIPHLDRARKQATAILKEVIVKTVNPNVRFNSALCAPNLHDFQRVEIIH
jgi:hypothetical protein